MSYRAAVGPIWKIIVSALKWDQTQLCSSIRLEVITNNIIYTTNVPYSLFIVIVLLITRERIELQSWDWSQMKALSLRISDLIYFLRFYCEIVKYAHVIVTCVNFCHFWSTEQPYFANNLRNKLAKNPQKSRMKALSLRILDIT